MHRSRVRNFALLVGVIATLALSGCEEPDTGPVSTEERPVGAFQAIELRGVAKMDVQVGPAPSLSVSGTENSRAAFASSVEGDTLILKSREGFWTRRTGKVDVRISLPQLRALTVSGAGDIHVKGAGGDSLALTLNGAANVEADGKVATLAASMNGAGKMDLSRLEAGAATVSVNGAGNMEVHATGSLDATVNGLGSVDYTGNPANVKTAINGVGSISPREEVKQ